MSVGSRISALAGGASGFSMTELLVSIVVFSVGVLGLASAVGVSSTEMRLGGRDTEVALLVRDQIETLKADGYEDLTSGTRTVGAYELDWEVVDVGPPARLVLAVTYPGHEGSPRTDTLVTYIAP